jgi:hypothetical protein
MKNNNLTEHNTTEKDMKNRKNMEIQGKIYEE